MEPWNRQLRPPSLGQVRNDTGMQNARGAVATTKGARYTVRDARWKRSPWSQVQSPGAIALLLWCDAGLLFSHVM